MVVVMTSAVWDSQIIAPGGRLVKHLGQSSTSVLVARAGSTYVLLHYSNIPHVAYTLWRYNVSGTQSRNDITPGNLNPTPPPRNSPLPAYNVPPTLTITGGFK